MTNEPTDATPERTAPSEAAREAVTMALYVSLVLAAEFVAAGERATSRAIVAGVIWGTCVGLAVTHVFAFNLAARLFAGGELSAGSRRAVWAQLGAAAGVALIVTVPLLFMTLGPALDAAAFIVAGLIGTTAYVASRGAGVGRVRSIVDGLLTLAAAILVVGLKVGLTGHG